MTRFWYQLYCNNVLLILLEYPLHTSHAATVEHIFEVTYFEANPDGNGDTLIQGINGSVHGPEIRVQRGDTLKVTVLNRLAAEPLAIHWHGFEMRAAQEYDGAMGITMCGIKPMTDFVYNFVVDELPGTYQYHEHGDLDGVATRGLFGGLVVDEPPGSPKLSMYSEDVVILLQEHDKYSPKKGDLHKMARLIRPVSTSGIGNAVGLVQFNNLLINGKGGFNVFRENADYQISDFAHLTPNQGETWRLRLLNAGNLFAMRFRIDRHRLRVIQTDGADVMPYDCDAITMSSGERYDVLVTFDQEPGSYWFRVET
jgi:FtsP/CotA-like multicopper oxidase with cupredoxin domain